MECDDGPGMGHSKEENMKMVHAVMSRALAMTIAEDEEAQTFFMTRKSCQFQCFEQMSITTVSTLYGKLGGDTFMSIPNDDDLINLFYEMLIGTFRACFPAPPRPMIAAFVGKLIGNMKTAMMNGAAPPPLPMPAPIVCVNELNKDDFPVQQFQESFGMAMGKAIAKDPRLQEYLATKTKSCQEQCAKRAITGSAFTLFLYDAQDGQLIKDALTGAFHACFPGIPPQVCQETVNSAVDSLREGQEVAEEIQAYRVNAKFFKSRKGLQIIGIAAAGVLMVFMAGCFVGRRVKRIIESNDPRFNRVSQEVHGDSNQEARLVLIPEENCIE